MTKIIADNSQLRHKEATTYRCNRRSFACRGTSIRESQATQHDGRARLRPDRRHRLRRPAVRAPGPQVPGHPRHGRRLLGVGHPHLPEQRRLDRLLCPGALLDRARPFLLGHRARRDAGDPAVRQGPAETAPLGPDRHLGGDAGRGLPHPGPYRPRGAPHRGVRGPGRPVHLDRLPDRTPHRPLRRNLAADPRRTVLLADLRPVQVRSAAHHFGPHRRDRQRAHARPDPPREPPGTGPQPTATYGNRCRRWPPPAGLTQSAAWR